MEGGLWCVHQLGGRGRGLGVLSSLLVAASMLGMLLLGQGAGWFQSLP